MNKTLKIIFAVYVVLAFVIAAGGVFVAAHFIHKFW